MFKLKKLIVVLVSIYLFSMSSIVFAAAHGHAKVGSGPNPYRDCGIGAAKSQKCFLLSVVRRHEHHVSKCCPRVPGNHLHKTNA